MKLLIRDDWELVGYRRLPYILRSKNSAEEIFLSERQMKLLLDCSGLHDVDPAAQGGWINALLEAGVLTEADAAHPFRLTPYRYYDSVYRKSVHWSVTGRCNYRCRHCFMEAPDAKFPEPSLELLKNYADQMAECGIRDVGITGGEPLIRPDFLELIDHLCGRGIRVSVIYSNGRLVTEQLLRALDERGVYCPFQFSYDGTEGWHDWLRNVEGAEADVLRAIGLCRKHRRPVSVSMCVHKGNVHTIRDSIRLLASHGVGSVKINGIRAVGAWKNWPEYALSREELCRAYLEYIPRYFADDAPVDLMLDGFFSYLRGRSRYSSGFVLGCDPEQLGSCYICSVTRTNCYLSPDGQVLPCMSMAGTPVGARFPYLREHSLREIFNDSFLTTAGDYTIQDFAEHNPACRACGHLGDCSGGCRASAAGDLYDDFLLPDMDMCRFFREGWNDRIREKADPAFRAYLNRHPALQKEADDFS